MIPLIFVSLVILNAVLAVISTKNARKEPDAPKAEGNGELIRISDWNPKIDEIKISCINKLII